MKKEHKKVLIVGYNYFPLVNPRSLRWTALAEKLVDSGYEVHFVSNKVDGAPLKEELNGVNLYRVGARSQPLPGESKSSNDKRHGLLKSILKRVYSRFFKYLIWPDSNIFWVPAAYKMSKRVVLENKIDKVLSISHPFSGHVVGYFLKKKFKKKGVKWFMDIGDPFSYLDHVNINNKILFGWLNFRFEKATFRLSDGISVTTDLTRQEYAKYNFPGLDKVQVIPPLLRGHFEQVGVKTTQPSPFRWVFVGTLYKNIRNPKVLLSLFSRVKREDSSREHELHFFGEYKLCQDEFKVYENEVGKSIFLHGVVPPGVAATESRRANLLVNIGNVTSYQLPSKLVEYISFGSYILNIKCIENCSSESFLKKYPFLIAVDSQKEMEDQAELILQKIKEEPRISNEEIIDLIKPFRTASVVNNYIDLISD